MGLLKLFTRPRASVQLLPSGSMTLDRSGNILATTVSSSFSPELLGEIGSLITGLFKSAAAAQLPVNELRLQFASLHITARELRGGAVIFLSPIHPFEVSPQQERS